MGEEVLGGLADAYRRVRDRLASGESRRGPPMLQDFLNAGMPEWMAIAAEARLPRRQEVAGTDAHLWWEFVRLYAASSIRAPN